MPTQKARLYFHDDAPRIGSGWRGVMIHYGRKWVRVVELATGSRARFTLGQFAERWPAYAPASRATRRKKARAEARAFFRPDSDQRVGQSKA